MRTVPRNRRLIALAAVTAVGLCAPAPGAFADSTAGLLKGDTPAVPAAQAYDGGKALPSTKRVTDFCAAHADSCRFVVDRAGSSEYLTAVKSLGNAVVNCSSDPIKVTRQVSLQVGSSDNLGGEITGQITLQGQLTATGAVTAGVTGEAGGNFKTPDQSKGPSAEVNAKGGVNGSGTLTGSASLQAAFQGAFKLAYNKTWSTQQTESTTYESTVQPGDALMFGASAAMQRIAGGLFAGNGLGVRNVYVDGPSSVNSSTFVAETYTVPGDTCVRVRPPNKTATDDTTVGPDRSLPVARAAGFAVELPGGLPAGSRLKQRVVLPGGRS